MLLLWSIRKPTTTGCFWSWLKNWMRCGRPSSSTRKSFFSRFETNFPRSSFTVTGTITSIACPRNCTAGSTGGWAGCCGGLACGGFSCGIACRHSSRRPQDPRIADRRRKDMTTLVLLYPAPQGPESVFHRYDIHGEPGIHGGQAFEEDHGSGRRPVGGEEFTPHLPYLDGNASRQRVDMREGYVAGGDTRLLQRLLQALE